MKIVSTMTEGVEKNIIWMMKFRGTVVKGNEVGGRFAVATANLKTISLPKLADGVYFIEAQVAGKTLDGLLHFGDRKTFGAGFSAEAHFLDFTGNLYGKTLEIEVLQCERDIVKFQNADALFTQIEKDIVRAQKFFLRRKIKTQWKKVSAVQKKKMAEEALRKISKNKQFLSAKRVFAYAPMENEISFVQKACPGLSGISSIFPEKKYFFPRVEGKELHFYESKYKDLRKGTFGILEPSFVAETAPSPLPKGNDIIFIPSVAVDKQGNRLGRGGGFYDRFLKKTSAYSIAIVPKFACVKALPTEKHDSKVKEVIVCSPS